MRLCVESVVLPLERCSFDDVCDVKRGDEPRNQIAKAALRNVTLLTIVDKKLCNNIDVAVIALVLYGVTCV